MSDIIHFHAKSHLVHETKCDFPIFPLKFEKRGGYVHFHTKSNLKHDTKWGGGPPPHLVSCGGGGGSSQIFQNPT